MSLGVIQIKGEEKLKAGLIQLAARLRVGREPLIRTKYYMLDQIKRNFASQGALFGEPWEPLTPMTIEMKRQEGFPATPLVRTGRMREAFFGLVGRDELLIKNSMPYFKKHQSIRERDRMIRPLWKIKTETGYIHKRSPKLKPLPRRVMMKLDKARKRFILREIFLPWVIKNIRETFQKM